MTVPKKIGITGGIGSGKSVVAEIVRTLGYPVYDSDERAKTLMQTHQEIRKQLIALLGEEVYTESGLNRIFLAERIFQNPNTREKVNAIVHPVVRADFANWANDQKTALVFQESALLFETGGYRLLDATILVTADEALRIQRVMQRDGASREQITARMSAQLPDNEKAQQADFVVSNNEQELLIPQIIAIIDSLKTNPPTTNH